MTNTQNERANARSTARASWELFLRGARRHADSARDWVRAEGLEDTMRAREAQQMSARAQRDARKRARRGKRASSAPSAHARAMTDLELKGRAFTTRALRSLTVIAIPTGLVVGPPLALLDGNPLAMLVWPAVYGYLVVDCWLFSGGRSEDEPKQSAHTTQEAHAKTKKPRASGLKPSADESAIMRRIQQWEEHATARRLHEVFPGTPIIDESGLFVPITFGGQWTPAKLDAQIDQFRSMLAVPDEVRTQIKPGGTADRANLRIRTRTRDLDLTWSTDREGLGLDADSAEVVPVDTTDRILIAGMSGAGKSVALRVLMAAARAMPHTVLVIIDLKVEGALWSHTARVESEPEGIEALVSELLEEMRERENLMRAQQLDTWEPTEERPRIIVVVDEGAELMAEVPNCVSGLRSIARRARSAQIPLWWATQKPTVTGPGRGLDSAISMQLTTQIALAVPSPTETRNVLGEDATMKGWHAEDLQKGGWALVRVQGADRTPDPMRVWFMTKEDVKSLPPCEPWRRALEPAAAVPNPLTVALRMSEGLNGVPTAQLTSELGISDVELHARMRELGAMPEPNAFAIGNGEKARGYRRSVLEAAKNGQR